MDQVARWCLPSTLSPESKIYEICWCSLMARGPFVRLQDRSTGGRSAQRRIAAVSRLGDTRSWRCALSRAESRPEAVSAPQAGSSSSASRTWAEIASRAMSLSYPLRSSTPSARSRSRRSPAGEGKRRRSTARARSSSPPSSDSCSASASSTTSRSTPRPSRVRLIRSAPHSSSSRLSWTNRRANRRSSRWP